MNDQATHAIINSLKQTKPITLLLFIVFFSALLPLPAKAMADDILASMPVDFTAREITIDKVINISERTSGFVLLIVNAPVYCSKQSQFESLQNLYKRYRDRGLQVLVFPSYDFSKSSKRGDLESLVSCRKKLKLTYPIFEPSKVRGEAANILFEWLTFVSGHPPANDFTKYLIDDKGKLYEVFEHDIRPGDIKLSNAIERLLRKMMADSIQ